MKKIDNIFQYIEYGLFLIFMAVVVSVPLAALYTLVGIEPGSVLAHTIHMFVGFTIAFIISSKIKK